jgi:hypothetical protein
MAGRIRLAATFALGIAVGVVATRMTADAPDREGTAKVETPTAPRVPASDAQPVPAIAAVAQPVVAPGSISADAARIAMPLPAAPSPVGPAVDSGAVVQAIDAGEVFNKVIAQPSQPGFENNIATAHRALERETRDDGWAYTMEAEIQNALVNEVSMGAFRSEHVECRATMCELRLSGKGEQGAAIKRWSDELGAQPFGQRLFLNYSSTISDNARVDTLMIFRRPPKN